jgi:hypothetical protein
MFVVSKARPVRNIVKRAYICTYCQKRSITNAKELVQSFLNNRTELVPIFVPEEVNRSSIRNLHCF